MGETTGVPRYAKGILRGDEFVSSEEIGMRVLRAAAGLRSLGVGNGDTVALLLRNDHPFFEASFAASALGAAPVPINWHGAPDEVGHVLSDSKSKVLVAHSDLLAGVSAVVPAGVTVLGVPTPADMRRDYGLDDATAMLPDGTLEWATWRDSFEPGLIDSDGTVSSMFYTSGTTGRPKGVRRIPDSHDEQIAPEYLADAYRVFGLAPGMRTVITGPMYHAAPNAFALGSAIIGDSLIVLQNKFSPEELLALVQEHRITSMHMVPTMFVRLLRVPLEVRNSYDLSSLVHISHGAAPCPLDVKHEMIEWLGPIVYEYYGATESGFVVGCDSEEWLAHPGTVGRPLTSCTVKVFDDDGHVAVGEPGEVFVRAAGFPDFTYEGRDEAREEVEREGLFTLGDVGFLDEDGFLYLCDRVRDMIISGGVNIYPIEIEACLLKLHGVGDCAVFGVPDEEFGEAVAAAVQLLPGATLSEDQIRSHVREHLAGFKAPKVIEFHDELPREDSGKIFKRKLRAPHWEASGRSI